MNDHLDEHEPDRPQHVSLKDGDLSTAIDLKVFMAELGSVMHLSAKAKTGDDDAPRSSSPAAAPPVAAQSGRSASNRRRGIVLGFVAVALGAVVAVARLPEKPVGTPLELRGRWTTTDPAFVGRSLIFTTDSVAIGRGPGDIGYHPVTHVRRSALMDGARYFLAYRLDDGAGEDELALEYRPLPTPNLQLVNRPTTVWMKD